MAITAEQIPQMSYNLSLGSCGSHCNGYHSRANTTNVIQSPIGLLWEPLQWLSQQSKYHKCHTISHWAPVGAIAMAITAEQIPQMSYNLSLGSCGSHCNGYHSTANTTNVIQSPIGLLWEPLQWLSQQSKYHKCHTISHWAPVGAIAMAITAQQIATKQLVDLVESMATTGK